MEPGNKTIAFYPDSTEQRHAPTTSGAYFSFSEQENPTERYKSPRCFFCFFITLMAITLFPLYILMSIAFSVYFLCL